MSDVTRALPMEEIVPLVRQVTAEGGSFCLYPTGISMLPLLREGKDAVMLSAVDKPRRGDIVLYRRKSGQYVLHRIIGGDQTGYILCGDNQWNKERGILSEQIIARVSVIHRGEESFSVLNDAPAAYRRYVRRRLRSRPLRHGVNYCKRILGRLFPFGKKGEDKKS